MNKEYLARHRIGLFFGLVILLSIPFWTLGLYADDAALLPAGLPIAALMAVCPFLAALILVVLERNSQGLGLSVRSLRTLPKNGIWYGVALLGMPAVMALCYIVMDVFGMSLPGSVRIEWTSLFFLLPLFLLGAIGEEAGWTGYILKPLKSKFGLIGAALVLALFGAAWHSIPLLQGSNGLEWILWQCIVVFVTRLMTVGLYFVSGQSLFVVILFHVMDNVSFAMFPNDGSHYNPMVKAIVLVLVLLVLGIIRIRK